MTNKTRIKKGNSGEEKPSFPRWIAYVIAIIAAIGLILSTQKTKYGPPKPPVSRGG
jgi:hypothetical protein